MCIYIKRYIFFPIFFQKFFTTKFGVLNTVLIFLRKRNFLVKIHLFAKKNSSTWLSLRLEVIRSLKPILCWLVIRRRYSRLQILLCKQGSLNSDQRLFLSVFVRFTRVLIWPRHFFKQQVDSLLCYVAEVPVLCAHMLPHKNALYNCSISGITAFKFSSTAPVYIP